MKKDKKVTGKTSTGFEFEVFANVMQNAEFLELFADVQDGENLKIFKLVKLVLGEDQKKKLYDHIRDEDGDVSIDDLADEVREIFETISAAKETKN